MRPAESKKVVYWFFALALFINIAFWYPAREIRAQWANVPPVPDSLKAASMAFGDRQLAYRSIGVMLQNLGDTGGQVTHLGDYDYEGLKSWFFLADELDPVSDYMPLLAARYFGSTTDPGQLGEIIDYLEVVGQRPIGEKWRWLSHAIVLARHGQEDLGRAFNLAQELAALDYTHMPAWTKMMPAFVLTEQGEKAMAYEIMRNILVSSADKLHPNEVNHIIANICKEILSPEEAAKDPLCEHLE